MRSTWVSLRTAYNRSRGSALNGRERRRRRPRRNRCDTWNRSASAFLSISFAGLDCSVQSAGATECIEMASMREAGALQ